MRSPLTSYTTWVFKKISLYIRILFLLASEEKRYSHITKHNTSTEVLDSVSSHLLYAPPGIFIFSNISSSSFFIFFFLVYKCSSFSQFVMPHLPAVTLWFILSWFKTSEVLAILHLLSAHSLFSPLYSGLCPPPWLTKAAVDTGDFLTGNYNISFQPFILLDFYIACNSPWNCFPDFHGDHFYSSCISLIVLSLSPWGLCFLYLTLKYWYASASLCDPLFYSLLILSPNDHNHFHYFRYHLYTDAS